MEYIAKNIPLWKVTTWDKKFNNIDKGWQPKTIKYKYLLSDELDSLRVEDGDVKILYTGKTIGYTTKELAGENISDGEIVAIPWGGIPTVKYHKGMFVTGDNRIATSNDTTQLSNKYLYYFMKGNIQEIATYYRGASLKHPCMKDILKMTISYPSIQEQQIICSRFDVLEKIIEKRNQELELLDDFIKARFVELFGDPKVNPKGYSKKQLKETCRVITGNTPSRAVGEYYGDHIEWIKTDNIVSGLLNPTTATESLSEKGMAVSRTVESGAILMACIAGSIASIGRVCVTDRKVAFNQQINAIVPSDYNILFLYVMLQISKEYLVDEINMALKGILSKSKLEEKTFYVPPMELQEQFAAFVTQVDKLKLQVQKSLDETQLLFDSLMQQYFG